MVLFPELHVGRHAVEHLSLLAVPLGVLLAVKNL
jgi:hypothetical protein